MERVIMSNTNSEDIKKTLASQNETKSFTKWFLWVVMLVIIGALIYQFIFNKSEKTIIYNTVAPLKKDLVVRVSATGNLEPTNSVDVGIEVSGTILEIYVDYNDVVKKGQVLAKLDTTKLVSQVDSTKAALSVANANLLESTINIKDAKRELERVQELYKVTDGNYPSTKEIDSALITYEKSKATHEALKAQKAQAAAYLKSNEEDLKKAIVTSPINGVVLNKAVEVGQTLVASMQIPTLFTLAEDLKKMEVIVSVDEADVGQVKKDQMVEFSVDAYPDKIFKGIIKQVRMNSTMVNNVVTYETVVTVDNSDSLLRPGMTVTADITTKVVNDALLVPNAALRFSPPKQNKKENSELRFFGPPAVKEKSDLSINSKKLWILKDAKAVAVAIELGDSDGVNSVIKSENISMDDKIIVGIQETAK